MLRWMFFLGGLFILKKLYSNNVNVLGKTAIQWNKRCVFTANEWRICSLFHRKYSWINDHLSHFQSIQCNLNLIHRCLINIYLILSTLITFPLRLALFTRLHFFFPKQEGRWSIMRLPSHYCHNEHAYCSVVLRLWFIIKLWKLNSTTEQMAVK